MSLLTEIQEALLREGSSIGPILLKLRFLAQRLRSTELEDWVRHESEGYPLTEQVPEYRKAYLSYTGTFIDGVRSISNVPVPAHIIIKEAGKHWLSPEIKDSISVIDDWVNRDAEQDLSTDCGNLALRLSGKVYVGYTCINLRASYNAGVLRGIQASVRSKLLDLSMEIEKKIPAAREIEVGSANQAVGEKDKESLTQIFHQTVYGGTAIANSGPGTPITVNVIQGDAESLRSALIDAGIMRADAVELAEIVASEKPESAIEPFGPKARKWLGENLQKASGGVWKVGISVATDVIREATMRYYGLK